MTVETLKVRVARKRDEADGICSLVLLPVAGSVLPPFTAGAHIDLHLGQGLVRQYSLCNPPSDAQQYVVAVLRDPASRGGSQAVHEQVKEGQELEISAPKNHFPLAADGKQHLLLAGGIGVTPLMAMAEQLSADGADFALHYFARSASKAAFADRFADSAFASRVHTHWDDAPQVPPVSLATLIGQPQAGQHLYVCGPKGFMDAVLATARAQTWPEDQLHFEFFGGQVVHDASDVTFTVKLASSGLQIQVGPEQTVVQALHKAGVDVPIACEQGVCGTCLTRVLSGVPDHKDLYLTPEEQAVNDQFTPCCSRAKTAVLVLDL